MLEEKITEVLDRLMELGGELGTPAFDAVVRGVQMEGIFSLIGGGVALVLFPLFILLFLKAFCAANAAERDKEGPAVAAVLGSGVLTIATGVIAPIQLFSSTNWIAAIDPVAEIARRIVTGG